MRRTADRMPTGSRRGRWAKLLTGGAAAVVIAGAGLVPASLAAASTGTAHRTTVSARTIGSVGRVLVDGQGRTLYVYTLDRPGRVRCTGACAKAWPPFLLPKGVTQVAHPAGTDLGTLRRPGGRWQVTSHELPLYRYVGDTRSGQASGEGLEGRWFVATPSGRRPASPAGGTGPPSATAPQGTGSSTTAPSTGPSAGTAPASGQTPGTTPPATTRPSAGTSDAPAPPTSPSTPATSPPATSPPATSPPPTSPPTTMPPPTSPPTTTPPPPTTTTTRPAGGGVAY